ncbi:MAG: hypothetical protein H0W30_19815 [Gemmatimonadaceae bacterium]|nr:hypothetical protein [Planctomycetaceae bacterium]MBA3560831.1 hypothetical protein [Gemmatimonadaceae bacterium]
MTIPLTTRDHDICLALTQRVRLLTVPQVAAVWWPETTASRTVHRRLEHLARQGWLERHVVNARPLLPVTKPLAAWAPGKREPDAERIAEATQSRWTLPAEPTEIVVATARTACLLGSTAKSLPPPEHRDHDLRLSAVYVHYRLKHPELASLWLGEHALSKAGFRVKDPDAFLLDAHRRVLRVIESAGRYGPQQVESFHQHCVEFDLPYELW